MKVANLTVADALYKFVNEEAIPGTGVSADDFWQYAVRIRDSSDIQGVTHNYLTAQRAVRTQLKRPTCVGTVPLPGERKADEASDKKNTGNDFHVWKPTV